jgi:DNA-binding transcriptional regulator GbsR (MarR family)
LSVARSNVSNSLKELQGWGVVKNVHVLGDRRDHYETLKDVWTMFRMIFDERKKRETDPTLALLRDLSQEAKKPAAADAATRERLTAMLDFFEIMTDWYESTQSMSIPSVIKFAKMGSKVRKLFE